MTITWEQLIDLLFRMKDKEKRARLKVLTFPFRYSAKTPKTICIPADLWEPK